MISETKIDDSFPARQFYIEGYTPPYRLDRNCNGDGITIYVREDIPSKLIELNDSIECIILELNFGKKKWLLCGSYNPHKNLISQHLTVLSKSLDMLLMKYDNVFLMGDFNVDKNQDSLVDFCQLYNLKHLIKVPTCYKNLDNPSAIDLMLTNCPRSYQHSCAIETGLSDFHKMTVTVLKTFFKKEEPKVITYRNYKNFSNDVFRQLIFDDLSNFQQGTYEDPPLEIFLDICLRALNQCAPKRKKYIRANNSPFMNRNISKAIVVRSRLRNKFLRNKTQENRIAYNQQRNFCVSLIHKAKVEYFNNLNEKQVTDNKLFWSTIKPFFSDKGATSDKYTLIENEEIIDNDQKISTIFNDFFSTVVSNLNIPQYEDPSISLDGINDPLEMIREKYKNHPSILAIREKQFDTSFSFEFITKEDIEKEILALQDGKACQQTDIPTKILKMNVDVFSKILYSELYKTIEFSLYPFCMKLADITAVHKKGNRTVKDNYRPVSILPNLSKVFERCLYKQISPYFDKILSKYQCGFRKNHSAQHCLLALLETWKSSVDEGKVFGTLLTDLSKAFDCLPHELFIAKLQAYGFDTKALKLIRAYLSNRMQRTKVGQEYSSWKEIKYGVPQGSILGPIFFNIDVCDLFFIMNDVDIASFADDNTPYLSANDLPSLIKALEDAASSIFKWFKDNQMQANAGKCHILLSTKEKVLTKVDSVEIENSQAEKLLGVTLDSELNFEKHINNLCGKAKSKLSALSRVAPYMNFEKKKTLMNAFFMAQFNYSPLVWMLHSRRLNNKINRLHERCLRVVYNNNQSSFEELLDLDDSVSIHHKNLQRLAIELYKIFNGISPDIMKDVFPLNTSSNYDIRNKPTFYTRRVRSVFKGTESLSYIAPKIWELVPEKIKKAESLSNFKTLIKQWKPIKCPCRICRPYIPQVGFV